MEAESRTAGSAPITTPQPSTRLEWIDAIKGIAILWVVLYHFFSTYSNGRDPSPLDAHYFGPFMAHCAPASIVAAGLCIFRALIVGFALLGREGVHLFLVMSGFGLVYSIARTGRPASGWAGWYRSRLLRLFPLYWVAHIVYLVSPFQFRREPIDYRFALSFLGDRVYPADTIFVYANSAWWFVGLLIEFYLMFPILYWMLREAGAAWFLLICGTVTIVSRYLILFVLPVTPNYLTGAFFGCRLWEFAFGMVMGLRYRQHREWMEQHLFSSIALFAGVLIYAAGLYSNDWKIAYTLTDGLIGTGLFLIFVPLTHWGARLRRVSPAMVYVGVYSYGLYLLHEPYVIYLGRLASHHGLSLAEFIAFALAVITLLVLICARLEQYVNRVTDRILRRYEPRTQVLLDPG